MAGRGAPKKLDADELWSYALRTLGQRAHSAQELKRKLSRRAMSTADLNAALVKLREYGFADDQKFSEAFAEARLLNQGFGRLRVLRELRSKSVESGIAVKAVEQAFSGIEEEQLIEQFLARKYRRKDLSGFLSEPKNLASAYRRLRVAGFRGNTSLSVLRRYSSKADDLTDLDEQE